MPHADLLLEWLRLVWIRNDFRKGEDYFAEGCRQVRLTGGLIDVHEYETIVGSICTKVEPYDVTLEGVIERGDAVSAIGVIKARRYDNAKPLDIETFHYRRIRDGKFVENRVCVNFISLFSELGQLPKDTLPTLLMGESLFEN